jgi:hypothetical protein
MLSNFNSRFEYYLVPKQFLSPRVLARMLFGIGITLLHSPHSSLLHLSLHSSLHPSIPPSLHPSIPPFSTYPFSHPSLPFPFLPRARRSNPRTTVRSAHSARRSSIRPRSMRSKCAPTRCSTRRFCPRMISTPRYGTRMKVLCFGGCLDIFSCSNMWNTMELLYMFMVPLMRWHEQMQLCGNNHSTAAANQIRIFRNSRMFYCSSAQRECAKCLFLANLLLDSYPTVSDCSSAHVPPPQFVADIYPLHGVIPEDAWAHLEWHAFLKAIGADRERYPSAVVEVLLCWISARA